MAVSNSPASPAALTHPPASTRPPAPFATTDEIRDLVAAFERCDIPRAAWNHRAHLAVALWYLVCYGPAEGGNRVRCGIQRLNVANGVVQTPEGGYHETLTWFYLWVIRRHLRDAPRDASVADLANSLIVAWSDKNRPFEYYSRDRLMSWEARTGWVEPDLRALD